MALDSVFFISCFLPVTLALYWLIPGTRGKNWVLLAVSLLFYSFGSLGGLLILLACCVGNYLLGLWIGRGGRVLWLGVCLNVAVLGLYKYLDFFLTQILGLPAPELTLTVPIGISFFTFKSISYLVDICRGKHRAETKLPALMLYLSFFPLVVSGPIDRYENFAPQLTQRHVTLDGAIRGLRRFVLGLGKRLLLATTLGTVADSVFALDAGVLDLRLAWLGAVAYSLQLYFDFSGYMDMAIGLAGVFGFSTVENFQYPYIASTIGGFWRRWHMSLSAWLRDYVYIPLGGNRRGKLRAGLNKLAVFLLCGLWHGAAWTYILWGVWHGAFSLLESAELIPAKKLEKSRVLGHVYTLVVVCLGFVIFRADSVSQAICVIRAMFTGFFFTVTGTVALRGMMTPEVILALVLAVVFSMPVVPWLSDREGLKKLWRPITWVGTLLLLALCLIKLAAGDFSPSIYAGF